MNVLHTPAPTWKKETRGDRADRCRTFLFHHDLISEEESDRLAVQIAKARRAGEKPKKKR